MEISIQPLFERSFRKLSRDLKQKAVDCQELFEMNPFDPRLGTHKLKGEHRQRWAFSVTKSIRIKFLFLGNGQVVFPDIGPHGKLYR